MNISMSQCKLTFGKNVFTGHDFVAMTTWNRLYRSYQMENYNVRKNNEGWFET